MSKYQFEITLALLYSPAMASKRPFGIDPSALRFQAGDPSEGGSGSRGGGVRKQISKQSVKSIAGAALTQSVKSKTTRAQTATAVKTTSLRLDPQLEVGLGLLKQALGKPVNKMINEAVVDYLRKQTAVVETDLSGALAKIKAYRRADPNFEKALGTFVEAEAAFAGKDPVEGVVVEVQRPKSKADGPAVTMVREILRS